MKKLIFVAVVALMVGCDQNDGRKIEASPAGNEPASVDHPRIPANVKTTTVEYGELTTPLDDPKIGRQISTKISFVVPEDKGPEVHNAINKNLLAVRSMFSKYFAGVSADRITKETHLARTRTELRDILNDMLWSGKTGLMLDVNLAEITIGDVSTAK